MRLALKQRCIGRNKQRLDADPLAKPTESHRAMLSWPCIPWGQVNPFKYGQVRINVAENLVLGTKVDNKIHLGWWEVVPPCAPIRLTRSLDSPSTNRGNLSLAKGSGVPAGGILPGER